MSPRHIYATGSHTIHGLTPPDPIARHLNSLRDVDMNIGQAFQLQDIRGCGLPPLFSPVSYQRSGCATLMRGGAADRDDSTDPGLRQASDAQEPRFGSADHGRVLDSSLQGDRAPFASPVSLASSRSKVMHLSQFSVAQTARVPPVSPSRAARKAAQAKQLLDREVEIIEEQKSQSVLVRAFREDYINYDAPGLSEWQRAPSPSDLPHPDDAFGVSRSAHTSSDVCDADDETSDVSSTSSVFGYETRAPEGIVDDRDLGYLQPSFLLENFDEDHSMLSSNETRVVSEQAMGGRYEVTYRVPIQPTVALPALPGADPVWSTSSTASPWPVFNIHAQWYVGRLRSLVCVLMIPLQKHEHSNSASTEWRLYARKEVGRSRLTSRGTEKRCEGTNERRNEARKWWRQAMRSERNVQHRRVFTCLEVNHVRVTIDLKETRSPGRRSIGHGQKRRARNKVCDTTRSCAAWSRLIYSYYLFSSGSYTIRTLLDM
jgi:hypothetical protein